MRVCNNCSLIEAEASNDLKVEEAVLSRFFHLSVRTAFWRMNVRFKVAAIVDSYIVKAIGGGCGT